MARRYVMTAVVIIAMSAFLYGCGDETTAPIIQDQAPLTAPTGVTATVTAAGVELNWDANSSTELRGYNVYRYDRSVRSIERLNGSTLSETSYLDSTAEMRSNYQYRVTSVSRFNVESSYSSVDISVVSSREKTPNIGEKRTN